MKHSIRTRFTLGMIFLFLIILVLSVFSGYYLNKMSNKTSAILKENYLSVVYAREMSEAIMNIDKELTTCFLSGRDYDTLLISKELYLFDKSLREEKNNLTEPGEDKLVSGIETGYAEYRNTVLKSVKLPKSVAGMLFIQNETSDLYQELLLLSQMNGRALELKTNDAKATSKSALAQMTVLATFCFLIGMSFTFSFGSYFNQRFFQLYHGIKEIVSSNFNQRLFFDGKDEFYEIALVLNEMADNIKKNKREMSVTLQDKQINGITSDDIEELKGMLLQIKSMEEQTTALISKFERK
jgi:two-component system, NtrC family, sensor histidine kinase KinB